MANRLEQVSRDIRLVHPVHRCPSEVRGRPDELTGHFSEAFLGKSDRREEQILYKGGQLAANIKKTYTKECRPGN